VFFRNIFSSDKYLASYSKEIIHNVTCRPIARELLDKQARKKYATNNRVDTFLDNARNTSTQQWSRCRKRLFLCGSHISLASQRMCFLWGRTRGYIRRPVWRPDARSERAGWLPAVSFCSAGTNTSTVTLRFVGGDEKGSLKAETVKYSLEIQGTRTRERLRWRGPQHIQKTDPSSRQRGRPTKIRT
jgi:hypothetical protein